MRHVERLVSLHRDVTVTAIIELVLCHHGMFLMHVYACREVAVTMAPVTPLILASEQLEPGSGLNYSTLAYMAANPTASALSVARQWGQDYLPSCMAVFGAGCTMAAISTGAPLSK